MLYIFLYIRKKETMCKYLEILKLNKKQLEKLNKLREMAEKP